MAGELRFDGRVAVITGAGGGLGRCYALQLADRGAKVVVNDLGGSAAGIGSSNRAADNVVEEIRQKGGVAVANYDSVEDGEKIIQTALDNFGRVDILINNAGILRDRSFARISDTDWDLVHRVHLRGSFKTTRAAWPHMRKQKFGRIIMTSSAAGVYGNFGQANYSAAKLGLVGLSNTVSIEGKKYGIFCNTIVPLAASRLTEGILPPDFMELMKPETVAPVVLWLCHESCGDTGSLIETTAGFVAKYHYCRSPGVLLKCLSPEAVRDHWSEITDMSRAEHTETNQEAMLKLGELLSNSKSEDPPAPTSAGNDGINVELAKAHKIDPVVTEYNPQHAILYAISIGIMTSDEKFLDFLYESSDNFSVFPLYGSIINQRGSFKVIESDIPGFPIDWTKVLHAEEYLKLYRPLSTSGRLTTHVSITDIVDKGSGALVVIEATSVDEKGEKVLFSQMNIFVVGQGGFGGPRKAQSAVPLLEPPSRQPDQVLMFTTDIDQAALYRLNGDSNPLHIDPSFAAMAGFKQPILHGMCSLGVSLRKIMQHYANDDVTKFVDIKARFTSPVIPGQTLEIDTWKEENKIHFQTRVKETGKYAIKGGYVTLKSGTSPQSVTSDSGFLASDSVFSDIAKRLLDRPELVKGVRGIVLWQILKNKTTAAEWTLDLNSSPAAVKKGSSPSKPDVTLIVEDADLLDLHEGRLQATQAFMKGRLKVRGNLGLLQKMEKLMRDKSNL